MIGPLVRKQILHFLMISERLMSSCNIVLASFRIYINIAFAPSKNKRCCQQVLHWVYGFSVLGFSEGGLEEEKKREWLARCNTMQCNAKDGWMDVMQEWIAIACIVNWSRQNIPYDTTS
ncbi:hypothetical protein EYC84_011392 [Monilinia fructicola]|uniref:Uncharacterized protein n=1 Tax=Monilinia fructicola TaxID=38448 RepID=A0A5M9J9B4_MONFR|nr:hypothetical protein EYC84_011392 [Monilinia fructicola]